jgi:hypothetical protein
MPYMVLKKTKIMKLENKIKKEFQTKEIQPSNNAWDVLSAQLDVKSTKKENKKLKILAYAAVFIGLLFGLITFLNNNSSKLNQPIIVAIDSVKVKNIKNKQFNIKENLIRIENSKIVEVIVKNPRIKSKKQIKNNKFHVGIVNVSKEKKIILDDKNTNAQSHNNELIAINNNKIKNIAKQKKTQISENQRNLRETKIISKKKKLFSSDADIDLMLANALNKNKKNTIQEVNIQSTYLQYAVENEINTPIGNKILKTLKAGVDTVEEYITSNN